MGIEYHRDDWEDSRLASMVLILSAAVIFGSFHTYDFARRTRRATSSAGARNVQQLRLEILITNWWVIIIYPIICTANIVYNVNDNPFTCGCVFAGVLCGYMILNFLIYRTLLAKSKTYDAMRQYKRLHVWVWRAVHFFCPMFWICLVILYATGNFTLVEYHGEEVCIYENKYLTPIVPTILLAVADSGISFGCLLLMVIPMYHCHTKSDTGVKRNLFWATIAILSTCTFLYFTVVLEIQTAYIIGVILDTGFWDAFVNILSINLCWPTAFYFRTLLRITGKDGSKNSYNVSYNVKNRSHGSRLSRTNPRNTRNDDQKVHFGCISPANKNGSSVLVGQQHSRDASVALNNGLKSLHKLRVSLPKSSRRTTVSASQNNKSPRVSAT
mmetsp:Transcript_2804/g.4067  ORF Transcript_2804/g.4067 Transcript_2804/m.4067 type:complete len:385 (-) Transcript_2804:139-1293(-)